MKCYNLNNSAKATETFIRVLKVSTKKSIKYATADNRIEKKIKSSMCTKIYVIEILLMYYVYVCTFS